MLGALLALASAVSITGLQAGTASADTQYGPTGSGGSPVLPTTDLTIGNPAVVHLLRGTNWSGQALEDAFNSSTPGAEARTWDLNYSNAQRIYFQRLGAVPGWYHVADASGAVRLERGDVAYYRIIHYTAAGPMCLDADARNDGPAAGSLVQWMTCDAIWQNATQQLWFVTTTTRDGFPGIYPTLINLASSPKTGGVALLDQAPVLAASANLVGQRSPLTLASRSMAGPSNSAWGFQNIGPEPPRADQKPCSNKIECLFTGLVR